jgi:hypothetical protein
MAGKTKLEELLEKIKEPIERRTSLNVTDQIQQSEFIKKFIKSSSILLFAISAFVIIYYTATDNENMKDKYTLITLGVLAIMGAGIFYTSSNDIMMLPLQKIFIMAMAFLAIGVLGYFYQNASSSTIAVVRYIVYAIVALIIIVGFAIFFIIFSDYLKKKTGLAGFLINFIFYIPCLLINWLENLKTSIESVPNTVFMLFVFELVLILLYIYMQKIIDKVVIKNKNILIGKPVSLDYSTTIGDNKVFLFNNDKKNPFMDTENSFKLDNYTLEFWAYINPQPHGTPERDIINCGNKPRITYDAKRNKMVVYYSNAHLNENSGLTSKDVSETFDIPLQRWIHIVVIYYLGKVDVFINGELQKTLVFNDNNMLLPTTEQDVVSTGSKNGLYGAICNVAYYHEILPTMTIVRNYQLYRYRNPPIPFVSTENNAPTTKKWIINPIKFLNNKG